MYSKRNPGEGQLKIYYPNEEIHKPILPDWDIDLISVSKGDRLAFLSSHEGESDVFILDFPFLIMCH